MPKNYFNLCNRIENILNKATSYRFSYKNVYSSLIDFRESKTPTPSCQLLSDCQHFCPNVQFSNFSQNKTRTTKFSCRPHWNLIKFHFQKLMQVKKSKKWQKVINPLFRNPVKKRARKKKRDLSGKFVILLINDNKKVGALLKFVDQTTCEVVTAIVIKKCDLKQTSRKFIISPKKNVQLLNKLEVVVNLKLQKKYRKCRKIYEKIVERVTKETEVKADRRNRKLIAKAGVPAGIKKSPSTSNNATTKPVNAAPTQIPKIKIFSCGVCNHKFTKQSMYEDHVKTHQTPDSSESENELVIDDDVMFVLDSDTLPSPQKSGEDHPDVMIPEKFICMDGICQQQFDTEQALIVHIGMHHEKDEIRKFKCDKCSKVFTREAGLLAHGRMVHAVKATTPELEGGGSEVKKPKPRRKSMYVGDPSKLKKTAPKQVFAPLTPSTSTNGKITFERFNSKYKKNFVCRICSTSFQLRQLLDRHVPVQHISKLYYCYKCTVALPMLSLFTHLKTVHADCSMEPWYLDTLADCEYMSVFRCAFCEFTSRNRDRVETHLRFEHYEDYEKSEDKDQQASSSDSLEELIFPDTAKKIAESELELKRTSKELELKPRRPINDPSFKFRCCRCQRRFSKSCGLKKHHCERQVNEAPKPQPETSQQPLPVTPAPLGSNYVVVNGFYRCPRCPQVFTDKTNFQKHVASEHGMDQAPKTGFYGTIINN